MLSLTKQNSVKIMFLTFFFFSHTRKRISQESFSSSSLTFSTEGSWTSHHHLWVVHLFEKGRKKSIYSTKWTSSSQDVLCGVHASMKYQSPISNMIKSSQVATVEHKIKPRALLRPPTHEAYLASGRGRPFSNKAVTSRNMRTKQPWKKSSFRMGERKVTLVFSLRFLVTSLLAGNEILSKKKEKNTYHHQALCGIVVFNICYCI